MTRPRLMILGASRYYIHCIAAAREMGCEVLATDRNPDSEGFRHADHHEVVDIADVPASIEVAQRYAVEGVIAVNDFGVPTAAAVAEALHLPGISPQSAQYATSKAWMRRLWSTAGVPSADFRVVQTLEEAYRAVDELNRWPLIVKPADSRGGGSRGVSRVDARAELESAVAFAQSFYNDKSVLIEEFLEGTEHSMETLTHEGETFVLAVSDKVKTPPPYRVDHSVIYPSLCRGAALEQICRVARAAVRALGIEVGAAHVELCMTRDGPKLFELGARCGGGGTANPIVPWVTGIDVMKEVIRLALGEKPQRLIPCHQRGCVYRFLMPPPGRMRQVMGLDTVRAWDGILDCEVLLKEGDEIRPVRTGGDRAGFVIAASETRAQALALADRAEHAITFVCENAAAA